MFLKLLLGRLFSSLVQNFVSGLRKSRADDERVVEYVRKKVAEAEMKFGAGAGEEKRRYVRVAAKEYAAELGQDLATAGVDALIFTAMDALGLISSAAAAKVESVGK